MRSGFLILPVFLCVCLASAQQAPLSGPVEGFIFDLPTESIRPVIGSLGSASLGQPILRAAYGSVAPNRDYALTFQGDRCTLVLGLRSSRSSIAVPGSFVMPEGVAWSGDGSTAVLYSRSGNWIQVLKGLPAAVNPGPSMSLTPLGGILASVTADLHGDHIVIGLLGEMGGVYQFTNEGTFVPLLPAVKPVALTVNDDGTTLYALDNATNQLVEQNLANFSFQSWPLDGLADPVALAATRDATGRKVVYVAGGNDRLLKVLDATTHEVITTVQLSFQPKLIEPLGGNSFLIGSRLTSDDILWSFTNRAQPAVYFVPAMPIPLRERHPR